MGITIESELKIVIAVSYLMIVKRGHKAPLISANYAAIW
jgi:hypothetical protein